MAVRLAIAQDEHADGDQHKGEQRADVGEVGDGADVEQAGGNADDESRHPGGKRRGAELRVHAAEDRGSSRSRDMANQTRAWPSWKTRMDEIMPSMAPISTTRRTQCSSCAAGLKGEALERVDHRRGVAHERIARARCR